MQPVDASRWHVWYHFWRKLIKLTTTSFSPLTVNGAQNVPRTGPALLACNHISYLDPTTVGIATKRRLRYMAKAELFKKKGLAWYLWRVGAFPVRRGEVDMESIRLAIDILKKGEALLIFPEGTRSETGELGPANAGVAMLAKRSGAPVIPTCIIGTREMLPSGAKFFKRSRITVSFGEPLLYSDFAQGMSDQEARAKFGEEIMARIQRLLEEARASSKPLPAKSGK